MGLKETIKKWLDIEAEERTEVLSSDTSAMLDLFGGTTTNSGLTVTQESSLRLSAVYACVRILSETIASLPFKVYRISEGVKYEARDHPLFRVLHDVTNAEQSSFEFRETIVTHLALWGNAYIKKVLNGAGHVVALVPLEPWKILVEYDSEKPVGKRKRFTYYATSQTEIYFDYEILHIKGQSLDGLIGLSPISYARESISLGLAAEQFGANYFGQGTNLGGTLEHPGTLSDEAYTRLKSDMAAKHQGITNSHGYMILEEGMKLSKTVIPPEDSQFIETRKFQLNEIARIFRVPPHMIADLEKATFSNIEYQSIDFVTHTIRPWLVRIEQAVFMQLFTTKEQQSYIAELNVDGLLRGDFKSRMEGYAIGRQNGWLSGNDIRKKENMPPMLDGDIYLVNGNMKTIGDAQAGKGGE